MENLTNEEKDYYELLVDLLENGEISDSERNILNKRKEKYSISDSRASEIEEFAKQERLQNLKPQNDSENSYYELILDFMENGIVSESNRKILNKRLEKYGITEARAKELEYFAKQEYLESKNKLSSYNTTYTNNDYRITDLLRIIEYNEEEIVNDKPLSIHKLLKESDIITLSIGMNELYYKLTINTDNIYSYIDEMMEDMSKLFHEINKYNHKQVFVLGYYNITNDNQDIFNYANIKLKNLCLKEGYTYIPLNSILNDKIYFQNDNKIYPNKLGYQQIYKIIVEKIKNY